MDTIRLFIYQLVELLQNKVSGVKAFECLHSGQNLKLSARLLCKQPPSTNITLTNNAKTLSVHYPCFFISSLVQV